MSLVPPPATIPALEQVYVALDLETTGLHPDRGDKVIEIGAVKFQGPRVIDTFGAFVNPGRSIPEFIQKLTGISPHQVSRARHFSSLSHELAAFLEGLPLVGHNISFDLGFLDREGLALTNPAYDTWDLASFLLPRNPEYNLIALAKQFGASHPNAHRAIDDADATRQVFLALVERAAELEPGLLNHIRNLSIRCNWRIGALLAGLSSENPEETAGENRLFGLNRLNLEQLTARLGAAERMRYDNSIGDLNTGEVERLMGNSGPFAKAYPDFEARPEQVDMMQAVASAIYQGRHLVVEGGTGVGKSMAYILPAALFAAAKGQRVVISTNTINLQGQLIGKDIPNLVEALEAAGAVEPGLLKFALLKGRANYLCLRRWNYLTNSESATPEDARLLSKVAVWLQDTKTGDRNDLNLSGRDVANWNKVSAGERMRCPDFHNDSNPCFLRNSRERAEQAHIVVVNHALLLSDLALGGGIIPDYQHLIIDEAHNLEDAATQQFSYQIEPGRLGEETEGLARLTRGLRVYLARVREEIEAATQQRGDRLAGEIEALAPSLRENWQSLWTAAEIFFNAQRNKNSDVDVMITLAARSHRSWSDLALAWENLDVGLNTVGQTMAQVESFLESASLPGARERGDLKMEADRIEDSIEELQGQLSSIINQPDENNILWLRQDANKTEITFHSAPLAVGATLSEKLFAEKESVILTSATMSVGRSFDFAKQRLGIPEESDELLVGSPFDYKKAALLLTPEDMPDPQSGNYYPAIAQTLIDLGKTLSGRTMALFTSYTALRAVDRSIRSQLKNQGIEVLAQGSDGSAQQVSRRFSDNHSNNVPTVLLGTSSFWEGVDFPGVLKALVITRLPFPVPSDPVFSARSEQYAGRAFNEYSVPLAVIRFRQGIGRLIRNNRDHGVIVVLDSRIIKRNYGSTFTKSIPDCTRLPVFLSSVGALSGQWVGDANRGTAR